jgi:hypothetical protein
MELDVARSIAPYGLFCRMRLPKDFFAEPCRVCQLECIEPIPMLQICFDELIEMAKNGLATTSSLL